MQNLTTKTVSQIALEMPFTTKVFENYKIDFCCGGNKNFSEACHNAGANPDTVIKEISALENIENQELSWLNTASLKDLIKHLEETHHVFTRDEIKNLEPLMAKVASKHGENHPELFELQKLFTELGDDLLQHLLKEEQMLFPYVISLERVRGTNQILMPPFGTVKNPVRMMSMEHDMAGDILKKMREISADYKIPADVCLSFTALYTHLEAFEKDLHQHIHLENNLLFPQAIKLEEEAIFSE